MAKSDLSAVIKEIKDDLKREDAQLKFLEGIQKIPSLEARLSLEGSNNSNQGTPINATSKPNIPKTGKNTFNLTNINEEGYNMFLLLNSIGK